MARNGLTSKARKMREAAKRGSAGAQPLGTPYTVIIGGSEGIGIALAHEFARTGAPLLLIARTEEPLKLAAEELAKAHEVEVDWLVLDVTEPGAAGRIEAYAAEKGQSVEVLVNSAGIGLSGPFITHRPEDVARLVDLNVRALTVLSRHFLPRMVRNRRGGILNVASLGGLVPGPNQAAYYASKAYVISLTESLAYEIADTNVRLSVLCPGPVRTKFHERMGAEGSFYLATGRMSPEAVARAGYHGFACGETVILPGLLCSANAIALKILPLFVSLPFMGWLLKRRRGPIARLSAGRSG